MTLFMLTSGNKIPALVLNDLSYNPALKMNRPVGERLVSKLTNESVFLNKVMTGPESV